MQHEAVRRLVPATGRRAELHGVAAGVVEAVRLLVVGQAQHAIAGAEAELGVGVALHDRDHEGEDMGTDVPGVLLQPGAGVGDSGAPLPTIGCDFSA